ncbi:DNA polymerase III subunit psi [Vibrio hannami]|uniref:DNA polymerase III subunit psi n=1 Tax=Vibrio hannami TaxID=2717094 RepID=UPI0024109FB2|nr:DNA polymerase III subunit psi [Vibrio hannami]MDG3088910.1 DNA polymerase III subunit psi [Vibrio hannami]
MSDKESAYLKEMGIECWELVHPERLEGITTEKIELENECVLLLISPVKPEGALLDMFEKVLKSIKLTLADARHLYPEQLAQLKYNDLKWVWFAGCEPTELEGSNTLSSPLLSDIDGNNQERRALWQQICSYDV